MGSRDTRVEPVEDSLYHYHVKGQRAHRAAWRHAIAGLCVLSGTLAGAGTAPQAPLIRCPDWQNPERLFAAAPSAPSPPTHTEITAPSEGGHEDPNANCLRHTVKAGDTFGRIAQKYLGTASRHPEIAAANPDMDPKKLRIGTVLKVKCTRPAPAVAGHQTQSRGPLSWLFDSGTRNAGQEAEVIRTPPLPQVWSAGRGEYLIDVIERWGTAADHDVIIEDRGDWKFEVPFRFEGNLRLALREVVKGFGSGPAAPLLVLYANRVIRIGAAR
ncbi:MAG: TcpQ domain-containing protein [Rhodobacteraceae bacterium]|nr:TcpQ domain-containing protein [Paracoccaceae bacterium]